MAEPKYPLEQLLSVKRDRVEKSEKVLQEKKRALEIEEEKLARLEKERDKVLNHQKDKMAQLRKSLDEGTTSPKIQQMKVYLEVVKEKLTKAKEKVDEQKKHVTNAKKAVDEARADLQRKKIEEEKIKMHKEEWRKEVNRELGIKEAKDHDEIGSAMYETRRRKKRGEE